MTEEAELYLNHETLHAGLYRSKAELHTEQQREVRAALIPSGAQPRSVLLGEDYSSNNTGTLANLIGGKRFAAIRVTGGLDIGAGGKWIPYLDRRVKEWLPVLRRMGRNGDIVPMVYGFPVDGNHIDLDVQLDVFLNTVGDFDGLVPLIDYEMYGPRPAATCTPGALHAYSNGIGAAIGFDRYQVMYAGYNFWNEPPYTGDVSGFRARLKMMNAWYRSMVQFSHTRDYYARWLSSSEWWHKIGGVLPDIAQIGIGVGNQDQDVCRHDFAWLHNLTRPIR